MSNFRDQFLKNKSKKKSSGSKNSDERIKIDHVKQDLIPVPGSNQIFFPGKVTELDLKKLQKAVEDMQEVSVRDSAMIFDLHDQVESKDKELNQLKDIINQMELDLVEARSSFQQELRQTKKEDVFNLIRRRSTVSEKMLNDWCFNQKTRKKKYNKSNEQRYQRIVNATLDLLDENNLLR